MERRPVGLPWHVAALRPCVGCSQSAAPVNSILPAQAQGRTRSRQAAAYPALLKSLPSALARKIAKADSRTHRRSAAHLSGESAEGVAKVAAGMHGCRNKIRMPPTRVSKPEHWLAAPWPYDSSARLKASYATGRARVLPDPLTAMAGLTVAEPRAAIRKGSTSGVA